MIRCNIYSLEKESNALLSAMAWVYEPDRGRELATFTPTNGLFSLIANGLFVPNPDMFKQYEVAHRRPPAPFTLINSIFYK